MPHKESPVVIRLPVAVRRRLEELGGDPDAIVRAVFDYLTDASASRLQSLAARYALVLEEIKEVESQLDRATEVLKRGRAAYAAVRAEWIACRAEAAAMAATMEKARAMTEHVVRES